jgi:hypothetical protein
MSLVLDAGGEVLKFSSGRALIDFPTRSLIDRDVSAASSQPCRLRATSNLSSRITSSSINRGTRLLTLDSEPRLKTRLGISGQQKIYR